MMGVFKDITKYGKEELVYLRKLEMIKKPNLRILFWETTLRCNAMCKHCGSKAGINCNYEDELTTNEIKKSLYDISHKFDVKKMTLNVTGGEPLLRKDLFEVMKYAKVLGYNWVMTTNGTLIDEEMVKKLKDAGLSSLSISIDGTEKTHDAFRGKDGLYNKSINAIDLLKKANFLNHIMITTVVNKTNINELEELYEIVNGLDVKYWRIVNIDPIGRANENSDLMLDEEEYRYLFKFIKEKRKITKSFEVTTSCSHYFGFDYEEETREWMFNCIAGIEVGSILYNGDIFVCPNVERRPELIQGNVRKDNFADVWNKKFEVFRNIDRHKKCKECNECKDARYCLGDSLHTWDFENNKPKLCLSKIL